MIELIHVEKKFENATPLKDVNVKINDGDVISIIGPSGTGKSTLIRCINMLDKPTKGQIIVDGQDITAKDFDINKIRHKMGMVFQSFNLFPHLTVIENIMKPQIELLGRSKQDAYDKAAKLLKDVGLYEKMLNYPIQLSGGQKQRIAICRTLAMDPEIILFDEPTSALDPTMIGEVQAVIRKLAEEKHTMMIVTHEMKFAREICNRVFYMDEGGVYEDGTPEQIFEHPQKENTIRFINQLKVLEFVIETKDFDFASTVYKIEEYCYKNQINKYNTNNIYLVFEELCKQIIAPNLPDKALMNVIIEYSPKKGISMTVKYNGKSFNPFEAGYELSLKLIDSKVDNYEYSPINEGIYTNQVQIIFK